MPETVVGYNKGDKNASILLQKINMHLFYPEIRAYNLSIWSVLLFGVSALLNAIDDSGRLVLKNDHLSASVNKSSGAIDQLSLDGQDLLGTLSYEAPTPGGSTGSGNSGIGPYLDCYCIPDGFYTPGSIAPEYKLIQGVDSTNASYGGIVMSETYPQTGQIFQQYWFLRDGETGLHTFSRLAYYNKTTPYLRNLQEFRTLFRPNSPLWTNLSTNAEHYAPLPSIAATENETTVQDATWYLGNTSGDPYVVQMSDYFTKYTFQDSWRDHYVHGIFADGSTSEDGSTFGAWLVMNTRDTYFGGPLHSDLTVDGIVYNYIVSNHHGDGTPNITDGFDRTFGPGSHSASLEELRDDALQYASPLWNKDFYDSIAQYVPNYAPSSNRMNWKGHIDLPQGAIRPVAVLSQNGVDFQDNVLDATAYQYWGDINPLTGAVEIPMVKAGTYRLTVYADGIFGQYEQDNITLTAGEEYMTNATWHEESAGIEIWRIGIPDKSSGEYRHGYEADSTHPLHPKQYRIYWAVYDFPTDFPDGVVFQINRSNEAIDLNYIHWSSFGGYANWLRPDPYYKNVNNWTILFDLSEQQIQGLKNEEATLTIQLAGAKTAAGNTDVYNASEPYSNLNYNVVVNGKELDPWVIP
ncbi:MAG: hypothetical protein M1834_006502 [Cirrosporium novae-zelandiae]|nr:MAG: hypothetical protein M1834_006502 [Cirrosporium novae-zelandiae]